MDGLYIGLDFGTSTNFVTKWDFKKKEAVPIENLVGHGGGYFFDNVIYYESESNVILGKAAIDKGNYEPKNLVKYVKRKITEDNWKVKINSLNKELTAKEVTRDIFRKIKNNIEQIEGGRRIDGVVISIPFAYGHVERDIIKSAAIEAGMNVMGLIEEPVAAALAFGLFDNKISNNKKNILVFDFGGGTLDVTIFESFKDDNILTVEVINSDGDKSLGGVDIDKMIYKLFLEKLPYKIEDIKNREHQQRNINKLCAASKDLKEVLSEEEEEDVFISGLYKNTILEIEGFTREQLNEMIKNEFMERVINVLKTSLDDANLDISDIDEVVLVGGTNKVPYIQEELKRVLKKDIKLPDNIEELVGLGAGIYCGKLVDDSLKLKVIKKLSHYIGLKVNGNFREIIEKNARYREYSASFEFRIKNNKENLNLKIYEGTSKKMKDASLIGSIQIKPSDFKGNIFRIRLGTDKNGMIMYRLFNKEQKLIKEGELSSNL